MPFAVTRPLAGPAAQSVLEHAKAMPMSLKEWEDFIISALRTADRVIEDQQTRGELQLYRKIRYDYWPLRFELAWEAVGGKLLLLTFAVTDIRTNQQVPVRDTASLRGLYMMADQERSRRP